MSIESLKAEWPPTETVPASVVELGQCLMEAWASDPEMAVELTLTVLGTVRVWVDDDALLEAARSVGRKRLEEWAQELVEAREHCSTMREILDQELRLSRRGRYGGRSARTSPSRPEPGDGPKAASPSADRRRRPSVGSRTPLVLIKSR